MKKVLITAGSTWVFLDKVRVLTNIFKGKIGTNIAEYFAGYEDYNVTLLTSNMSIAPRGLNNLSYKTYEELLSLMEFEVRNSSYDIIIHSAAVSDYKPDGMFEIDYKRIDRLLFLLEDYWGDGCDNLSEDAFDSLRTTFDEIQKNGGWCKKIDDSSKISSKYSELTLRLIQTDKIIDLIRPWGFTGKLVKFKLQVGLSDRKLLKIARKSMEHSKADLIVANCLEWCNTRAYIIDKHDQCNSPRLKLPEDLFWKLRS